MAIASTDWLETAERVRIPMRRVMGAHVTIFLGRLPTGSYQVAVSASAPGHGGFGKMIDDEAALPNRFNAVLAGIRVLKRAWGNVPVLVADLSEAAESEF